MAPTSFVSAAAAQEAAEGKKTKRLIETNSSDTLTHTWNIGDHPPHGHLRAANIERYPSGLHA